jgi:AraC family transcriptional regulator
MMSRSDQGRMHRGGLPEKRLRQILDHIAAHLDDELTLSGLAAIAGLSMYHFAKAFRVSTGLPPYRYVLEARIRRAAALLRDTEESISQIALATGFSDQSQLARQFRRRVGTTPSEFRHKPEEPDNGPCE